MRNLVTHFQDFDNLSEAGSSMSSDTLPHRSRRAYEDGGNLRQNPLYNENDESAL